MANSLRIAVVSPHGDGYSETFIRMTIEELDRCELVLSKGYPPEFYDRDKRILAPEGLYGKATLFIQKKLLKRDRSLRLTEATAQLLKERRIDVVLAHYASAGAMVFPACKLANVPLVVHCHGFDVHSQKAKQKWGAQYPAMGEAAAAVVVVSETMKTALANLGVSEKKITCRPCGTDVTKFTPVDPASNPPTFAFVGRFVDKKAPYLLLDAFRQVHTAKPEARLMLVGDGPLFEATKNLATCWNLLEAVDFTGPLPHEEVATRMSKARAYVQHSIVPQHGNDVGDSEGTPVAVLEASATGLPVVATAHAGIKEAVLHCQTGFLVDERDTATMARHMIELVDKPQLASELGIAGRQHIKANYSKEQYLSTLTQILQQAAGK